MPSSAAASPRRPLAAEACAAPLAFVLDWMANDDEITADEAVAQYRQQVRLSVTYLPARLIPLCYEERDGFLHCRDGNCGAHPMEGHAPDCSMGLLVQELERVFHAAQVRRTNPSPEDSA